MKNPSTSLRTALATPRQMRMTFGFDPLQGMSPTERQKALAQLAAILIAASMPAGGSDDDRR